MNYFSISTSQSFSTLLIFLLCSFFFVTLSVVKTLPFTALRWYCFDGTLAQICFTITFLLSEASFYGLYSVLVSLSVCFKNNVPTLFFFWWVVVNRFWNVCCLGVQEVFHTFLDSNFVSVRAAGISYTSSLAYLTVWCFSNTGSSHFSRLLFLAFSCIVPRSAL